MIQISKGTPPAILSTGLGAKSTESLKQAYDTGERDFSFRSTIYGSKSVKDKLIKQQNGKCCFCESKITHISYGDVEHFRPKGGYLQDSEELNKPGYYWLAYDWNNLFLSCQLCNQRYKRNHFPLQNAQARVTSHHGDIANEDPVFVHPSNDDPEQLIGFRQEIAFGVDSEGRGEATITALALDRIELEVQRREMLQVAEFTRRVVKLFAARKKSDLDADEANLLKESEDALKKYGSKDFAYSSMLRFNGFEPRL